MNRFLGVIFLLLSVRVNAQSADPGTFQSVFASHDIVLNTDPSSPFWKTAPPIYVEVDSQGNVVPGYRTTVRSRWTNNYLYLLFVCPYEELHLKPNPTRTAETNKLWNWDVAEIFIGSDFKDIKRYKEFEMSPQGEWVDLDINLNLAHHENGWTWNSGVQVSARIDRDAKIWYGSMRIPLRSIESSAPKAGDLFRVNLFRSQGPPGHRQEVTWKAPMSHTFHVPEKFGKLELVKGK